jgi:hypothetical protein
MADERVDHVFELHVFALSAGAGVRADGVVLREPRMVAGRELRDRSKTLAPAVVEAHLLVDRIAALVDETVMAAAEQEDVVEVRFAAERPVAEMVPVRKRRFSQPGKRQPRSRTRNARRSEGGIVRVLRPKSNAPRPPPLIATTEQSHASLVAVSGAIAGPAGALLEARACAVRVGGKRIGIDVYDELIAVTAGSDFRGRQRPIRDFDQRLRACRARFRGTVLSHRERFSH